MGAKSDTNTIIRERIPVPGQRIIRSVVAVWLCFAVYFLRGRNGIPFFSAIAVLQCMQPYTKDMWKIVRDKIIGTLIGSFWGLLLLLSERALAEDGIPDELPHFLLVGLFTGIVIYFTVLFRLRDVSYFSAVIFLTVVVMHSADERPYLYVFDRTLDTMIGLAIGEVVNRLQLPRRKNTDVLYASGIGDFVLGTENTLTAYSKIELNRLIEDGAKFTIATVQTQATVRELVPGLDLRYPIVTMNGAALYDTKTLEYLRTKPMTDGDAERIIHWLRAEKLPFFSNSIEENLLVIHYTKLPNTAMQKIYENKRRSPYRNYLKSPVERYENIVYLLVVDTDEAIAAGCEKLLAQPWSDAYRVVRDSTEIEGYSCLKIYDAGVSKDAMLRELAAMLGVKRVVTFGCTTGRYDVTITNGDRNQMVKELRARFEPVDFRCVRSIFRV